METKFTIERYEAPQHEATIFDYVKRIVSSLAQLLVALKYQIHKSANGTGVIKLIILGLMAIIFLRGSGIFKSNSFAFGGGKNNTLLGFSLSPAEPSTLRDEQVMAYVNRYKDIAVEEGKKFDIPPSISLAQGIVESRCGESTLAAQNNNHFGIKCFSHNCPKGHCSNFTDDSHKDFFRKYNSPWESWREHSKLLSQERYKPLRKYGNDYEQWAKGLSEVGYATDDEYADKLIAVIEKYNLDDLDE
jgi:hypothetical protein